MPKTQQQIKHDAVSPEVWRPQRTQVGGLWFDPLKIRPMGDHILVVLDEATEKTSLVVPDMARNKDIGTRTGVVIAVGPGKLKEIYQTDLTWEMPKIKLQPTKLKPGDRVIIGHYSDWESWSADFEGRGANVVLCQEADVRLFEEHDHEILSGSTCIECGREVPDEFIS